MFTLIAVLAVTVFGVVGVVGSIVAIVVNQSRRRHRRADEMAAWARVRGWTVLPIDPTVAGLACPPVERGGRSRWVTRGVGDDGHPVVAFEWSRWESSGSGFEESGSMQTDVLTTVVASTMPGVHRMIQVPPGRPRRGLFGLGRPDPRMVATGRPDFDQRCTLIADDPHHAAHVLPPPLLEQWAADPRSATTGFRLHDAWLVCWQSGGVSLERLDRALDVLAELREAIDRSQTPA